MRRCLAIALSLIASCAGAQSAELLQAYTWHSDDPGFGGLSGFDFTDSAGTRFVAVSDRGGIFDGTITRDGPRISSVQTSTVRPIPLPDGRVPAVKRANDSEGLAIGRDGRRVVSFEGTHSLRIVPRDGPTRVLPGAPEFRHFISNASLEALAIDDRNRLYTLPERSGQLRRAFPVYRLGSDGWERFGQIARHGGFFAVGADIGPDGRFYLLERSFTGLGFRSRVRRFTIGTASMQQEETLLITPTGRHQNLEAIAVWRAADGLRMTLVSDDNFSRLLRTQLVEYALRD